MARLFVAVRPPAPVLDAVSQLSMAAAPGVRWVPRDQWHITVRFIGEATIEPVTAALDGAELPAGVQVSMGPRVSRLGKFVVCVPATGLDGLMAAVVSATVSLGNPPESRPYFGHLTLARLESRAVLPVEGTSFAASFPVAEVELVQSTQSAGRLHHEVIARWPLA